MADNRWIRVSDQDRENAAELLIEAYAVGRVSREKLDERAIAVGAGGHRGPHAYRGAAGGSARHQLAQYLRGYGSFQHQDQG